MVDLVELEFVEQGLDLGLVVLVLSSVVLFQNGALGFGCALEGLVDKPTALVILDVCANLAQSLGVGKVVEVVVLDLEVLAHWDENVLSLLQVLLGGQAAEVQGQRDGEVEGVVRRLENDDEGVLFQAEVVEIDVVLGGGQEVAGLAKLRLERRLVEEFDEVDVGLFLPEVLFQQNVDARLEHKGIIDGNHADIGHEVPARRAAAGLGRVHDVVRDEEEGLQKLNHPAKRGRLEVLVLGEVAAKQQRRRVDDRHAPVALSAHGVVVQRLYQQCQSAWLQRDEGTSGPASSCMHCLSYFLEPCQGLVGKLVVLAVVGEVCH